MGYQQPDEETLLREMSEPRKVVCTEGRKTSPVRTRSVEVDLQLLYTMLRWAVTVRSRAGKRLRDSNPLAGVRRPREKNPKRPVASWERYLATRSVLAELIAESKSDVIRRKWLKLDSHSRWPRLPAGGLARFVNSGGRTLVSRTEPLFGESRQTKK